MIKRRLNVMLILVLLVGLLAACGGKNSDSNASSNSSVVNNSTSSNEDTDSSLNEAIKDPYEIAVAFPIFSSEYPDLAEVEAEISAITKEKINATVDLMPISIGAYQQQMNLMSSGGEKLDLYLLFGQSYGADVASGKLVGLNSLLDQYGQDLVAQFEPEHLNSAKIKGEIYAVPVMQDFTTGVQGVMMRKDIVDKHNIDVSAIQSLEDLGKVYEIIKANEPDMTPLGIGLSGAAENYFWYDKLGDRYGVLPGFDNDLQVVNLFESDEYEQFLNTMNSWFNAGYINKDASTNETNGADFIKSGKYFSYFTPNKPGQVATETVNNGTEMVFAAVSPEAVSTTSNILLTMYGISANSKNPERSAMFLNLLYSDADIANLFLNGIKDKHYVVQDNGTVDYPEGFDRSSVGYKYEDWLVGNSFIAYSHVSTGPDIIEKLRETNKNALKSKALGFVFDSEPVKNEITALNNVVEQYSDILETGTIAASEKLEEFRSKLKAAGIDKVIAEKQKQLDEWAAANK